MYSTIRKYNLALWLIACILLTTACNNSYQDILNSENADFKFEKAKEFYNRKDYYKAQPIFEELLNVHRGTKKAEKIYYYYAYCHYGQSDMITAAYHFKNFAVTYPASDFTEEAQYMWAYCYYQMSPKPSLDQTNTIKAIEAFQLFTTLYPTSEKVAQCNNFIDEMRLTLQQKDFMSAKLYLKLEFYEAAKIAFETLLRDYPDFKNKEEARFLALKAYYLYASNSIEEKQKERFTFVVSMYEKFLQRHPQSSYTGEAEKIAETSRKYLNKI